MSRTLVKTTTTLLATLIATMALAFAMAPTALADVTYANGVTKEMTTVDFWASRTLAASDAILATPEQIEAVNAAALNESGTNMHDLEAMTDAYDASKLFPYEELSGTVTAIDNEEVTAEQVAAFYANIHDCIDDTRWTDIERTPLYAVAIAYADMKCLPTDHVLGYGADDTDDEAQGSALCVNEPFVIKQMCTTDEGTYYWGYSRNCIGWVNAEKLAICSDYDEWIDAWKVDMAGDDFLVLTQSKAYTEKSLFNPATSNVMLTLGTIVKLVPDEVKSDVVEERYSWHNYVIYLPARNADGTYSKQIALFPERYSSSVGFLPLTQENVIRVAMSCVGDRYGWGGMLDSMDCSSYVARIYRCFGYELPRNTTWQQRIPGTFTNISSWSDTKKQAAFQTLPAGSMLYFSGHTMLYLGSVNGVSYVIDDLGALYQDSEFISVQGIVINPLTVKRGNGKTWLTNMSGVVVLSPPLSVEDSGIEIELSQTSFDYDGKAHAPEVTVLDANGNAMPEYYYTVECEPATAAGTYELSVSLDTPSVKGSATASFDIVSPDDPIRIKGTSRYETSIEAANYLKKINGVDKFDCIVVACGSNYPDALTGSYLAKKNDAPVILVNSSTEEKVATYIDSNLSNGGKVYLLGGTGAVSESFASRLDDLGTKPDVKRLGGANRYDTNLMILQEAGVSAEDLLLCSGSGYADSLSASATGLPIMLVGSSLTDNQKKFIAALDSTNAYAIGGSKVVSDSVMSQVSSAGIANVSRVSGATRYLTSVAVAEKFFAESSDVVLAYAQNFPDGLSGGPIATSDSMNSPLILVDNSHYEDAKAWCNSQGCQRIVVMGGEGLISDSVARSMKG